ncbi:hypothetical protein [Acidocella facilis]|uniref:hypothetical protein n=1 Tax=Acidocella facilis TaxID=525 RepID=UPI001F409EB8|nr:hypothetical protein [Acidocella facilis]
MTNLSDKIALRFAAVEGGEHIKSLDMLADPERYRTLADAALDELRSLDALAKPSAEAWLKIEGDLPQRDARGMRLNYILCAKYPNGYWSDPTYSWMDEDGSFPRWKHVFPPTHFITVDMPSGVAAA